ncbi:Pimeloyl-ACP methyl ester carboxylesterase [Pseudonocardia ammonioxydans]|uniref:Pimeloyl-ACP methyl ester carboxylesterase n=1 Tax=Pseudonocardia ammonioxydans TaxID=260086 RepID=A0A1I4XI15_PSUAM|nr:alpha/beta fold hydrolase [Pseudonocardia ammonioxydans]SFN25521.1 Pimeloyl-ACP methyl ester carboxylesterase [Pseudonocardia ammonioxydans]
MADASPVEQELLLHGQRVSYREAGQRGRQAVLLVHGLAAGSLTWDPVLAPLGRRLHVLAPDLLGHGASEAPRSGDYSLGGFATGLRDLLVALDVERVTIVGHSFGGGVAMQFAHQFPERTERVVLVSSGGLGHDLALALRAASLPGSGLVLRSAASLTPPWMRHAVQRIAHAVGSVPRSDVDGVRAAWESFSDHGTRGAFVQTARGALEPSGQRLDGAQRLHLLSEVPVLLVAGDRDKVIPVEHTLGAHERLPGSRLEIFDGAGHFPHAEQPRRFAALLREFVDGTEPADGGREAVRRRILGLPAIPAPADDVAG